MASKGIFEEKIPNFRAPERPMAHYFGRGLTEQQLCKLGALMTTCYTSLCFDLSLVAFDFVYLCYVSIPQLIHCNSW